MGLIQRTSESDVDLRKIYKYIAVDNASAAERLLLRIKKELAMLSDMPGGGAPRPDLGIHVRTWPVGKYLLLYRPINDGIELLRVIHGMRKVRRVFRRREI